MSDKKFDMYMQQPIDKKNEVVNRVDPMALWNRVNKTNPNMSKEANNGRFKFTAIDPQYQLQIATEQFGPYGSRWGLRSFVWTKLEASDTPILMLEAEFFYPNPNTGIESSFPIAVDIKLKPGDDCCKKLITQARSKALSFLGFNADVFMGKFDDAAYVKDLQVRYGESEETRKLALAAICKASNETALDAIKGRVDGLVSEENIPDEIGRELYSEIEKRRAELTQAK